MIVLNVFAVVRKLVDLKEAEVESMQISFNATVKGPKDKRAQPEAERPKPETEQHAKKPQPPPKGESLVRKIVKELEIDPTKMYPRKNEERAQVPIQSKRKPDSTEMESPLDDETKRRVTLTNFTRPVNIQYLELFLESKTGSKIEEIRVLDERRMAVVTFDTKDGMLC